MVLHEEYFCCWRTDQWRGAVLFCDVFRLGKSCRRVSRRRTPLQLNVERELFRRTLNGSEHLVRMAALRRVKYGDLSNPETLLHGPGERGGIDRPGRSDARRRQRRLVEFVRHMNPSAIIIANAVSFGDCAAIYAAGADYVFLSRLETARALSEAVGHALDGTLRLACANPRRWRPRGSSRPTRPLSWLESRRPENPWPGGFRDCAASRSGNSRGGGRPCGLPR